MGLKPGKTNNPKGRPPGKPNLSTAEAKEIVNDIIKRNFTAAKVQKDLKALQPGKRLEVLTRLLQFTLPRPTEANVKFDFEALPPEKIESIYQIIFEHGTN
jgi:hypothetical protein